MNWETFLKEIKKLDIELTLTQQNQLKEFYKLRSVIKLDYIYLNKYKI